MVYIGRGGPKTTGRPRRKRAPFLSAPMQVSNFKDLKDLAEKIDLNFEILARNISMMLDPISQILDDQGQLNLLVSNDFKKSTASGNKDIPDVTEVTNHVGGEDVAAGALATKGSVDMATSEVTNKVMANISDAGGLATKDSVGASEISTGAVSNTHINASAAIDPTKVLISGSVYLDDWRNATDNTKVNAGDIDGTIVNGVVIGSTNGETAGFIRAGAVRAMNAIDPDGISIAGNLVHNFTGADDGTSVTGCAITSTTIDAGGTGGGGTGEGGDPVEP